MRRLLEKLGVVRPVEAAPPSPSEPDKPVKRSKKEIRDEQEQTLREQLHLSDSWRSEEGEAGFTRREYQSYEQYLEHQKSKLAIFDLSKYDVEYRQMLRERLEQLSAVERGHNVLCLAARIGTEVKAFIDLGCFAIGIDLNPGDENHFVVHGDFHDLQYADDSLDAVFTNSLDHAYEIERILREVTRVLKPGGRLITEIVGGTEEGQAPKFFESFAWEHIDDAVKYISQFGFTPVKQLDFEKPWGGRTVIFERSE